MIHAVLEQYEQHSISSKANWDNPAFTKEHQDSTADSAGLTCVTGSHSGGEEIMQLMKRHIEQFLPLYKPQKRRRS